LILHKQAFYLKKNAHFTVFQKVMWNITFYCISQGLVKYYVLLYFRRSCGKLHFIVFQKVMWNIAFYCISEGHVEYYVLLYFTRSCGILRFTVFQKVMWNIYQFWTSFSSPGQRPKARWAFPITWRPSYVVNFFKNLLLWDGYLVILLIYLS
jgi:hypothetical protein